MKVLSETSSGDAPPKKSPAGMGACVRKECIAFAREVNNKVCFHDISILRAVNIRVNKINKDYFFSFIEE